MHLIYIILGLIILDDGEVGNGFELRSFLDFFATEYFGVELVMLYGWLNCHSPVFIVL